MSSFAFNFIKLVKRSFRDDVLKEIFIFSQDDGSICDLKFPLLIEFSPESLWWSIKMMNEKKVFGKKFREWIFGISFIKFLCEFCKKWKKFIFWLLLLKWNLHIKVSSPKRKFSANLTRSEASLHQNFSHLTLQTINYFHHAL
jgi:hypothetical protein